MKTILAFDPGAKNCGYAVLKYQGPKKLKLARHEPQKASILEAGLLFNTVHSMVSPYFESDCKAFIADLYRLINIYSPDEIYLERYQTRGFKGTVIEAVNTMIGIVTAVGLSFGVPTRVMIASQWKTQYNRTFNSPKGQSALDELYKQAHNSFRCPPHVIDAICINLYGNAFYERKNAFKNFPKLMIGKFLKSVDWKAVQKELEKQYKQRTKGR